MKIGFLDSGIRLNQVIAQKDNWGLPQLEERNRYLIERALEIWAASVVEYKPEGRQMDLCSLDDDTNLSGRVIARFSYRRIEQPVASWIEMCERVMKMLHAEDK